LEIYRIQAGLIVLPAEKIYMRGVLRVPPIPKIRRIAATRVNAVVVVQPRPQNDRPAVAQQSAYQPQLSRYVPEVLDDLAYNNNIVSARNVRQLQSVVERIVRVTINTPPPKQAAKHSLLAASEIKQLYRRFSRVAHGQGAVRHPGSNAYGDIRDLCQKFDVPVIGQAVVVQCVAGQFIAYA
jgi:hypothetical protein